MTNDKRKRYVADMTEARSRHHRETQELELQHARELHGIAELYGGVGTSAEKYYGAIIEELTEELKLELTPGN